ncbi:SDR family NAD(P)-dependent oxidoreductase [Streptomyces sp. NPDC012888]|uniref:SDR family NAD(P)-dependent oxidoreductase n=1 Tax=Streptomyces sp. NPDC012888 TaxID=3364855 RepID=UPI0036D0AA41
MSDGTRPLALVTGASSGIGLELGRELAVHGYDLILAAEDDALHTAAERLRHHGTDVRAVQADLATYDGVETVYASTRIRGAPVDVAVLNAGVGRAGPFLATELADQARVIDVNVSSTVHLAHRLLPGMVDRGAGRMLVTSSAAADLPGPYQAVQNATQAFLKSFALALNGELDGTGVTVTALLPGATDTRFFVRAGLLDTRVGRSRKTSPETVARQGCAAVLREHPKAVAVAGPLRTRVGVLAADLLPATARAALHRRRAEPGGGQHGL